MNKNKQISNSNFLLIVPLYLHKIHIHLNNHTNYNYHLKIKKSLPSSTSIFIHSSNFFILSFHRSHFSNSRFLITSFQDIFIFLSSSLITEMFSNTSLYFNVDLLSSQNLFIGSIVSNKHNIKYKGFSS